MSQFKKTTLLASLVAIAGSCVALLISGIIGLNTHTQNRLLFTRLADRLSTEVSKRFHQYEYGLRGARSLFVTSQKVVHREFQQLVFSRDLVNEFPGSLGIGFIELIDEESEALENWQADLVADGSPEFSVSVPSNAPKTSGAKLQGRMIIKYIEPYQVNRAALGLDIGAEPVRREAAERAYTSNSAAITGRIQLVQSEAAGVGFLYLLPCFNPTLPVNNENEKRAAFLGWTYMPIVASEALKDIENIVDHQLGYRLFDGTSLSEDDQIACSSNNFSTSHSGKLQATMAFQIGGRTWTLELKPTNRFRFYPNTLENVTLLGGISLSMLLAALVWTLSSRVDRAESKTEGMTKDLRRMAMVAERTTNAVIITDRDQRIVWCNEGFTRLTEHELDEVQGKKPSENALFSGSDPNTIRRICMALKSQKGFCGEIQNRSKSGRVYWVNIDIQPLRDDQGEHIGFLAIGNDITEAKEFADRLKSERDRTELALAGGKLGIWTLDIDSNELATDQRWTEITGDTDSPASRSPDFWIARMPVEDGERFKSAVKHCISTNTALAIDVRMTRFDGQLIWLHLKGQMTNDSNDSHKLTLAGTVMEITESMEDHLALRESEARLAAMFLASHDAIFLFRDGLIDDCNPRAVTMFGRRAKEELLGLSPTNLSPPFQRDGRPTQELVDEIIAKVFRDGFACFDWIHARPNGENFEVEVLLSLVCIGGEQRMQGTVRDVSQRRELERQLLQSQKLESIGQLAAGVAHEINTPMQCVFSNVEYLQSSLGKLLALTQGYREFYSAVSMKSGICENVGSLGLNSTFDRLSSNVTDAVREAAESSNRVIEIVRAMKAMSHPGTVARVKCDLNKLIQDASVISRNRWKYAAKLELDLDESIGVVSVFPAQLSQVILNLIVNAADAIIERYGHEPVESGNIRITSTNVDDGVMLEFADDGVGIPASILNRVFDPFFTTKEVGKGTGQGLSIAYDVVVNLHGGRISVASTVGMGAKFNIWLPAIAGERNIQDVPYSNSASTTVACVTSASVRLVSRPSYGTANRV